VGGEFYASNDIITIIFLLLMSTMGIAMVGSNLPALVTARIAGRFAFDVID
jgi:hypothetical protein